MEVYRRTQGGTKFPEKGIDRHAAMDEAFESRPNMLQVLGGLSVLGGVFTQSGGENQNPTWDAGEHSDIERTRATDDGVEFGRPVGDLGDFRARFVEVFLDPAGKIEGGDSAQVTGVSPMRKHFGQRRKGGGSAEKQMSAAENRGTPGADGIIEQRIETGLAKMRQHAGGDRKILRAAHRRTRGDGKVRAASRPQYIGLAALHPLDGGRETFVGVRSDPLLETGVVDGRSYAGPAPIRRGGEPVGEALENARLLAGSRSCLPQSPARRHRQHRSAEGIDAFETHAATVSLRNFTPR